MSSTSQLIQKCKILTPTKVSLTQYQSSSLKFNSNRSVTTCRRISSPQIRTSPQMERTMGRINPKRILKRRKVTIHNLQNQINSNKMVSN